MSTDGSKSTTGMIKLNLSEDDTSAKFITPALYQAGWTETAIRRQVAFTAGRIIVRGKLVTRGKVGAG
jgi:type I restriction enzyme R subunit